MISLCSTCRNRLWQLKKTLPKNLEFCKKNQLELCLVNYGSNDGLEDWIKENYLWAIKEGILRYYSTASDYFNAPHAKNIAHAIATNELVMNLDCDNFVNDQVLRIAKVLQTNPNLIVQNNTGSFTDGTFGRILLSRDNFKKLNGYDENMWGMAYQDTDILSRARALGLDYEKVSFRENSEGPIPIFNSLSDKASALKDPQKYKKVEKRNQWLFRLNKWTGAFRVKRKDYFAVSQGTLNFEKEIKTSLPSLPTSRNLFVGMGNLMRDLGFVVFHRFYKPVIYKPIFKIIHFIRWNMINLFWHHVCLNLYRRVRRRIRLFFSWIKAK
ncbi:MAG: glycosyltransferase family 2 protein [Halobacteriovoraceae bacterium]|nr:glycosyltransferase family 2 protein [Halobacteriovoraceae bacterium]